MLAAQYFGSKDDKSMHELVHTAIPTSVIGGVLFGAVGILFAETFLSWMKTPASILDEAALYVKIYCAGIPFSMVYNFGAAILRSVGDTKRPLFFLFTAGILNVIFNLLFVLCFHMDVDGVATATVLSQAISAGLVLIYMSRIKESHRFVYGEMKFYKKQFFSMVKIGLPAGIQGSFFSISNIIIQSSINGFGEAAISGNTAAVSIEGFVFTGLDAFYQTTMSFTGQHIGAKKYGRLKKITLLCLACVTVLGLGIGGIALILANPLVKIYCGNDTAAIEIGVMRLEYIVMTYFTCGIMDVFSGMLRGMGYSTLSMIITLVCVCGIRILWIFTIFRVPQYHELWMLYLSYPISWIACIIVQGLLFLILYKKLMKNAKMEAPAEENAAISPAV